MTKAQSHQQSQSESEPKTKTILPGDEAITSDLILRSHILTEEIISQLRKRNCDSGIEGAEVEDYGAKSSESGLARRRVKLSETTAYIQYQDPQIKKKKLRWLSQVQNQRTGQFYTLENLIQNNVISESERDLFEFPPGITDFPFRQIYQFYRVKRADGSEYFWDFEVFTGISRTASVLSFSTNDTYSYIKPTISYELRNIDGSPIRQGYSVVDNKTVQIATTKVMPTGDISGRREYILKFTPEVAYSALRLAHGSYTDAYQGCSLGLIKEGEPNPIGIKDAKLWAEGDFNEIFAEQSKPTHQTQINVDPSKLMNYLKSDAGSKENHSQYS